MLCIARLLRETALTQTSIKTDDGGLESCIANLKHLQAPLLFVGPARLAIYTKYLGR